MRWMSVFCILCVFGCASTRKFSPGVKEESTYNPDAKSDFNLTCAQESSPPPLKFDLAEKAAGYRIFVLPSCPRKQDLVKTVEMTKPLNLVFVIDITGSMGDSLQGLRTGIATMVANFQAGKWDVKVGAVGFVDLFADFRIVDFADVKTVQQQIETWDLMDGGDFQEAGLIGIEQGVIMIKSLLAKDPTRAQGRNVIIYVSDAPAYYDLRHNDNFSLVPLLTSMQSMVPAIGALELFYSTPAAVKPDEKVTGAPEPQAQMGALATQAKLGGGPLKFPLQADVLNDFSKTTQQITVVSGQKCYISTATLVSQDNAGIPSESKIDDPKVLQASENPLPFKTSPDLNTNIYDLTIVRCCKSNPDDKDCTSTDVSTVRLNFGSK